MTLKLKENYTKFFKILICQYFIVNFISLLYGFTPTDGLNFSPLKIMYV